MWDGCALALRRARPRRRLSLLLVVYLALTLLLGWRLVTIQVVDADRFRELATRQTRRELTLPARRGKIYDRAGEPLAMSLASATLYADPGELREQGVDPAEVARRLAPVLDRRPRELTRLLSGDTGFVYLGRQLPREVGTRVEAMDVPGVGLLTEPRRVYPAGGLAGPVVGFSGIDGDGLAGLELGLDDLLSGRPGRLRLERAPSGLEISTAPREIVPSVAGGDVVLTLDRQVQSATERVLARAVADHGAEGGSAIVMDVASGEVLAMASQGERRHRGGAPERNRVVTDVYEPGSVNKVITASAALEEGVVRADESIRVPDGYEVGGKRFTDSHPHDEPRLTFREILTRSSNIGTIKIAERLGSERLAEYLRRFGYGRSSGLEFPGESAGLLAPPDQWSATSLPTISIGQGVSATLLQVADVFATIARGGTRVAPSLVRGTVDDDGRLRAAAAPERRRVISRQTATTIAGMLVGVIEDEQGTCELCAVPGYEVAGKTGTAQKPSTTRLGYEPGAYIASFVGFAPADDPALVVGVALDEPRPVYYGGLTAGPAFSSITNFALRHRRIPPANPRAVRPTVTPGAPVAAPPPP